jgi:membrane dipeptidase
MTRDRPIGVVPEIGRVPGYLVPLDDAQEARVRAIAQAGPIISLHDHASVRPIDASNFGEYRRRGRETTPYEGLGASPLHVVFDGGNAGIGRNWRQRRWRWDDTLHEIRTREADWAEHSNRVRLVRTVDDARSAPGSGVVGIAITLESATPIGREIDRLNVLHALGVRSIGVTYSEANRLGSGCAGATDGGLTSFGKRAVHRMNELGILVDVSHAGDRTSLDVIAASRAPVVVSHAGARAIWPTERMKPDDVIRACAASGGLIGIEAAPGSTRAEAAGRHSIDDVGRHLVHCLDLVGIEHVTFGPDTHYGDHVAWNLAFGTATTAQDLRGLHPPWVVGAENPTEAWWNILRWLVRGGYTDAEIHAMAGGNTLRVLEGAWRPT